MIDEEENNDENKIINKLKPVSSMYDETVEVTGADDVQSPPTSANLLGQKSFASKNDIKNEKGRTNKEFRSSQNQVKYDTTIRTVHADSKNSDDDDDDDEDDDDDDENDDDDDDDDDVRAPIMHGAYDPLDYEQLPVSEEIKNLFNYITKYTPQNIELENKLCPFLPDFIPAVGDIDAFIKVPRPDGAKDGLGLTVLDEPCTQQSDSAVLQLQLRALAKQSSAKAMVVKKIENGDKNTKAVDKWITAISDLHSKKPSPTVKYTNPMPNLDGLMQEWPSEIEKQLSATALPHPDLDCDLSTYAAIICNLFDIPVYESKVQSLHTFFSLYSNMKSTERQLFQTKEEEQPLK